jgi:hypothetical protein
VPHTGMRLLNHVHYRVVGSLYEERLQVPVPVPVVPVLPVSFKYVAVS